GLSGSAGSRFLSDVMAESRALCWPHGDHRRQRTRTSSISLSSSSCVSTAVPVWAVGRLTFCGVVFPGTGPFAFSRGTQVQYCFGLASSRSLRTVQRPSPSVRAIQMRGEYSPSRAFNGAPEYRILLGSHGSRTGSGRKLGALTYVGLLPK